MTSDLVAQTNFLSSVPSGYLETVYVTAIFLALVMSFISVAMFSGQKTASLKATNDEQPDDEGSTNDCGSDMDTSYIVQPRFRSLSLSLDIEFPGRNCPPPVYYHRNLTWRDQQCKILANTERYRTMSTNYIEKYRRESDTRRLKAQGLQLLREQPETFPIESLPEELKLKILSFLTAKERGVAAHVCTTWRRLTMVPSLWSTVDFRTFPLCVLCADAKHECNLLCYTNYKNRIRKFFYFLIAVRPALRALMLEFDIDRDGWMDLIQSLLRAAYCDELKYLYLNWKETKSGGIQSSAEVSHTWSSSDYNDLMFHHRHRQRSFVKFFDFVVTAAPNIESLTLPFDWSERSMQAIGRLRNLNTLVLQSYFWTHWIEQSSLSLLLQMTPNLKKLVLEVSSHSIQGLTPYVFESYSLEELDLSASRGMYLARASLPNLARLRLNRSPLVSPLGTFDSVALPCIYHVLCDGTPKLSYLNNVRLLQDWAVNYYDELERALNDVCCCSVHFGQVDRDDVA